MARTVRGNLRWTIALTLAASCLPIGLFVVGAFAAPERGGADEVLKHVVLLVLLLVLVGTPVATVLGGIWVGRLDPGGGRGLRIVAVVSGAAAWLLWLFNAYLLWILVVLWDGIAHA